MHRNLLELPKEPANHVLIQVFKHNISFYRISPTFPNQITFPCGTF